MNYDTFLSSVQSHAQLETLEQAAAVVSGVLQTLGECLSRRKCDDLAAELPHGIKELLYGPPESEKSRYGATPFSLEEFYNRAHARSGLGFRASVNAAMAVAAVLRQGVSSGALANVIQDLRPDVQDLFK